MNYLRYIALAVIIVCATLSLGQQSLKSGMELSDIKTDKSVIHSTTKQGCAWFVEAVR
jgi:hypothetical protein